MATMNKKAIEKLVIKAQNGDRDCFAKLFDLFFDKIFRHAEDKKRG